MRKIVFSYFQLQVNDLWGFVFISGRFGVTHKTYYYIDEFPPYSTFSAIWQIFPRTSSSNALSFVRSYFQG